MASGEWNYLLTSLLIIWLRLLKHKIIPFSSVWKGIWVLDYSCMRSILTVWIEIYTDLLLGLVNRVSVMVLTNRQYFTLIKSSRICFSSFRFAPWDDWSMRNVIFPNDPIARINLLTPKISYVILFTVCHTTVVMLIWRIWYWIN